MFLSDLSSGGDRGPVIGKIRGPACGVRDVSLMAMPNVRKIFSHSLGSFFPLSSAIALNFARGILGFYITPRLDLPASRPWKALVLVVCAAGRKAVPPPVTIILGVPGFRLTLIRLRSVELFLRLSGKS